MTDTTKCLADVDHAAWRSAAFDPFHEIRRDRVARIDLAFDPARLMPTSGR